MIVFQRGLLGNLWERFHVFLLNRHFGNSLLTSSRLNLLLRDELIVQVERDCLPRGFSAHDGKSFPRTVIGPGALAGS